MRWRRFFRRASRVAESARDIQFYLDTEIRDNIARGMSPGEARAAASRNSVIRLLSERRSIACTPSDF
jgi:hypothetical protein